MTVHCHNALRWELFLVTAGSREKLPAKLTGLEKRAATAALSDFRPLALELAMQYRPGRACVALISPTFADLAAKLAYARTRLASAGCRRINDINGVFFDQDRQAGEGKIAFLFPGFGSQYVNMLRETALRFEAVREVFDETDRDLAVHGLGFSTHWHLFPPSGKPAASGFDFFSDPAAMLTAVCTANLALLRLLEKFKIRPHALAGHSVGEFTALHAAGVFEAEGADRMSETFSRIIRAIREITLQESIPAHYVSVNDPGGGLLDGIMAGCGPHCLLTMNNCPQQKVFCLFDPEEFKALTDRLEAAGGFFDTFVLDFPVHTPKYASMARHLESFMTRLSPPGIPLYSCLDGRPYPSDPDRIWQTLLKQWYMPVEFEQTVEALYRDGVRLFIEAGPRGNLTGFVANILGERPFLALACDRFMQSGVKQFLHMLGRLAAQGLAFDPSYLFHKRDCRPRNPEREGGLSIEIRQHLPRMVLAGRLPGRPPESPAKAQSRNLPHEGPPDPADTRVSALERVVNILARAVSEQAAVVADLKGPEPPDFSRSFPLLRPVRVDRDETGLRVHARLTLKDLEFVRDHSFGGRQVSVLNPDLAGYCVMPLAGSLELVAECACLLAPDRVVTGITDISAYRWMAFEQPAIDLVIRARPNTPGSAREIRVAVREGNQDAHAFLEATVLLDKTYPDRPRDASHGHPPQGRPVYSRDQLYETVLFHGPSFQGIRRITDWDGSRLTGQIKSRAPGQMMNCPEGSDLLVDLLALDALLSSAMVWWELSRSVVRFLLPIRISRIDLFSRPAPGGTLMDFHCLSAGHNALDESLMDFQAEAFTADSRPYMRIRRFTDKIFPFSRHLKQWSFNQQANFFSRTLPLEKQGLAQLGIADAGRLPDRISVTLVPPLTPDWLDMGSGFWRKIIEYAILAPPEQKAYREMPAGARRKADWLLGRTAAKDAVRKVLNRRHGTRYSAADILVDRLPSGRPFVSGGWQTDLESHPAVSIAHTRGPAAVGIAVADPAVSGVGIDIERRRTLDDLFAETAFSSDETALFKSKNVFNDEWMLRGWCAKEAVGKALGKGILEHIRHIRVRSLDTGTGIIRLSISRALREEVFGAPEDIQARTFEQGEYIFGLCLLKTV